MTGRDGYQPTAIARLERGQTLPPQAEQAEIKTIIASTRADIAV
jgi:hypothetical protein